MTRNFTVLFLISFYSCQQNNTLNFISTKATQEQEEFVKKRFSEVYGEYFFQEDTIPKSNKKVIYHENYKITFKSDLNQNNTPSEKCCISILGPNSIFNDTLDFKSSAFVTSLNADIDIFDHKAYIIWVSENTETTYTKIWLKVVNLKSNNVEFFNSLYQQRWGIERIAIAYNPFNKTIHVAYNDFSKANSRYLYLGTLKAKGQFLDIDFQPKSILNQDKSEKRYPKFLRTANSMFFYHTSGDTWGLFAHTGKQGIGISQINELNEPSNYRILADTTEINNRILIHNDTVFFELKIGTLIANFPVKKARLTDLPTKE